MAWLGSPIDKLRCNSQNIILCGDSAGGNACLALAKCLGEMESLSSKRFGQVGGLCLHSVRPFTIHTRGFQVRTTIKLLLAVV